MEKYKYLFEYLTQSASPAQLYKVVPSSLSVVTVLGLFVFIDPALPSLCLSPSCILEEVWVACQRE